MFHLPSIKQSMGEALSGSSNPWQPSALVWFWRIGHKKVRVDAELVCFYYKWQRGRETRFSTLLLFVSEGISLSLQRLQPTDFPISQTSLIRLSKKDLIFRTDTLQLHLLGPRQNVQQVENSSTGRGWRAEQRLLSAAAVQDGGVGDIRRIRDSFERRW